MQIVAIVFLVAACMAAAQKAEEIVYRHPLTDMPPSAEDVESSPFFPDHTDQKFPIGEVVTALCHFTNDGPTYYNVSAIMGSLNSPFEFSHHFQNYSYKSFGTVVKPGEEITFKYTFQLHKELEPVDYQLAITVFYESEQHSFSTTFFNQVRIHTFPNQRQTIFITLPLSPPNAIYTQTVELYFPTSEFDVETVSAVLYGIATLVAIVLVTVFACFPETKVPVVSEFFAKVNQLEKNNIRTLSTKVNFELICLLFLSSELSCLFCATNTFIVPFSFCILYFSPCPTRTGWWTNPATTRKEARPNKSNRNGKAE